MIRLTPYKQKPNFCGPVALQVVFAYYGVSMSEKKIAELCNTIGKGATREEEGTLHKDLVAAARSAGFRVEAKAGGTIKELKEHIAKKIPVIVGWYAFDNDHYSIVYNVTDNYIHMVDTESHLKKHKRHMLIERFKELWFDYDNREKPEEKTFRWFMVIAPPQG